MTDRERLRELVEVALVEVRGRTADGKPVPRSHWERPARSVCELVEAVPALLAQLEAAERLAEALGPLTTFRTMNYVAGWQLSGAVDALAAYRETQK